jgi:hypothetical protein
MQAIQKAARFSRATAVLAALTTILCSPAKSGTFFITEGVNGTGCENLQLAVPQKVTDLPCNGAGGSSIIGSAESSYRKLGVAISGYSNPFAGGSGDVGANFDQIISGNSLTGLQSGDLISFLYEIDGLVSVTDPNKIGLSIVSNVDGTRVLSSQFYIPAQTGFYSQIFSTKPVPVNLTGSYDLYLGADNTLLGSAGSNFFNTLYIQEISVTDSNGKPVDGVSFTFGDGSVVEANQMLGSPDVPECSGGVMLLSGLSLMAGTRWVLRKRIDPEAGRLSIH